MKPQPSPEKRKLHQEQPLSKNYFKNKQANNKAPNNTGFNLGKDRHMLQHSKMCMSSKTITAFRYVLSKLEFIVFVSL